MKLFLLIVTSLCAVCICSFTSIDVMSFSVTISLYCVGIHLIIIAGEHIDGFVSTFLHKSFVLICAKHSQTLQNKFITINSQNDHKILYNL